ncbi:recombinase family protein [Bradyrhizobium sp. CB2312]|uniref:recombinase family protein n=1 Tax=Bradyrhizobium sp. CB2312 TaxID=3039155 RepID=UPI0024B24C66|nr:recombinase family protein [Bradyrhizobium sp. CB2312]WFU69183.1 recombinase family protein [Bradyrhizobium sp. CB2312]
MINDVQLGAADFGNVLVRDVSRWGRFQDTDESAYYEFICKLAGVKVLYCAEVFDNDGSPMSGLWKNMKRLMAAEDSRNQSAKVFAGRAGSPGLAIGWAVGPASRYARELIDATGKSRGSLEHGQQKALQTDRVLVRAGPPDEIAIVRWIFESFVAAKENRHRPQAERERRCQPSRRSVEFSDDWSHPSQRELQRQPDIELLARASCHQREGQVDKGGDAL